MVIHKGFTLIEFLVCCSLMVLSFTMVGGMLSNLWQAVAMVAQNGERHTSLWVVSCQFARDIVHAPVAADAWADTQVNTLVWKVTDPAQTTYRWFFENGRLARAEHGVVATVADGLDDVRFTIDQHNGVVSGVWCFFKKGSVELKRYIPVYGKIFVCNC